MSQRKLLAAFYLGVLILSGCATTHTESILVPEVPRMAGDRYSLLAEWQAFTSITEEEKAQLEEYMERCPEEKGAKVYYDPLYRGFYEDFSTLIPANMPQCYIPDGKNPFIDPMALPPIIPARLVSIYDKLPPVIDTVQNAETIEEHTRIIAANIDCSVNRIASVTNNGGTLRVEIVAEPMWRYLDKDPSLFLSEKDRASVVGALQSGIPVTFTLTEDCPTSPENHAPMSQ